MAPWLPQVVREWSSSGWGSLLFLFLTALQCWEHAGAGVGLSRFPLQNTGWACVHLCHRVSFTGAGSVSIPVVSALNPSSLTWLLGPALKIEAQTGSLFPPFPRPVPAPCQLLCSHGGWDRDTLCYAAIQGLVNNWSVLSDELCLYSIKSSFPVSAGSLSFCIKKRLLPTPLPNS